MKCTKELSLASYEAISRECLPAAAGSAPLEGASPLARRSCRACVGSPPRRGAPRPSAGEKAEQLVWGPRTHCRACSFYFQPSKL